MSTRSKLLMKIGVKMDPADNVAVVMQNVAAGDEVAVGDIVITAINSMDRGHKIATEEITMNGSIVKYGVAVGKADCDILIGQHVHTHNVLDITKEVNACSFDTGKGV